MQREDWRRDARRSWEKFLDVESLRLSLTIGSVYLTAYELLLDCLVERLKSFYASGWNREDGVLIGPRYQEQVMVRHKLPYLASADWFRENGALDEADVDALKQIREHRNFVAHNIPRIVMEAGVEVDVALLGEIVRLVAKLDRWWLKHVEVPSNPDFDDVEVSDESLDQAFSMRMHNLNLLISVVGGNEQPIRDMHATFMEVWPAEVEDKRTDTPRHV